jgi:hypothetical protein
MSDEKISSALGIRPMADIDEDEKQLPATPAPVEEAKALPAVVSEEDDENLQDIESVRKNVAEVMETGKEAMLEMLEIAKQSEQPRAFEVVSTLMKTLLDANKDFADISTKKKFAKEEVNGPKEAAQTNTVNNNLIVSTADLLKMLKDSSTKDDGVIDG